MTLQLYSSCRRTISAAMNRDAKREECRCSDDGPTTPSHTHSDSRAFCQPLRLTRSTTVTRLKARHPHPLSTLISLRSKPFAARFTFSSSLVAEATALASLTYSLSPSTYLSVRSAHLLAAKFNTLLKAKIIVLASHNNRAL